MHISLAYFQSASDNNRQPTEQSENVLEGKILNQLIHQLDPSKIPQTNFRVKRQLSSQKLLLTTAMVSLVALLLIYLLNFGKWSDFVASLIPIFLRQVLLWTTAPLMAIFSRGYLCCNFLVALKYKDEIHEAIQKSHQPCEEKHGFAIYLDEALSRKVSSIYPDVEEWNGELWCVTEIRTYDALSPTEYAELDLC